MPTNSFWLNTLDDIEKTVKNAKMGKHSLLSKSEGGRDIYLLEYGPKQNMKRKCNYNGALYYRSLDVYADKSDAAPIVLIVGATHGGEIEGVSGILNFINALETGEDLRGHPQPWASEFLDNCRLLIIPCLNPDGRARTPFTVAPSDPWQTTYYKHGQYKDGTLMSYTDGMHTHPVLEAAAHMGGYYNDAGVNLYADNYFSPMSPENISLFKLVDEEAPDLVLLLHTGCHRHGKLLTPYYMPGFTINRVLEFDNNLKEAFEESGYTYYSLHEHKIRSIDEDVYPPPRFPMETAIHHSCGALSVVYESYQAVDDADNHFSLDHVLNCHMILFKQSLRYARKYHQDCLNAATDENYERARKRSY